MSYDLKEHIDGLDLDAIDALELFGPPRQPQKFYLTRVFNPEELGYTEGLKTPEEETNDK